MAEPATDGSGRLAVGVARSSLIRPEWMVTDKIVEVNAEAVLAAAADARVETAEVEYVVGKAYYPSVRDFEEARAGGHDIPVLDEGTRFKKASGGAGLGVAVATEGMSMPKPQDIGSNFDLWSAKVAVSADEWEPVGGTGPQTQLIAFGNSAAAGGRLRVGHSAMNDLLDADALTRALRRAGLQVGPGPLSPEHRKRVVAVYVKFSMPPDNLLRGRRQVVENPQYGNQVKAALGGMFSGVLQDNLVWISASATHQGPLGGGTVAAIVDVGA